jgi:sugar/nucleoside kinase (ribokinase family)
VTAVLLAGLCTVDLVQRVEAIPQPGEKFVATSVELLAGGPAANAAVAVAAVGGKPVLLTGLGGHPLSTVAATDLHRHGVEVLDLLAQRAEPPTVSAVAVRERDGERTVVSHNASGVELSPPAELHSLVARAGAVLLDGHHARLALATATAANRLGVPVVLDAGSFKPVLEEVLPMVNVCACSATFRLPGRADAEDTERALHDFGIPVVTRTRGAEPVTWSCRVPGAHGLVAPVQVTARDTAGAGDVWHGALAHGIARLGRVPLASELPSLISEANEVAARRVRRVGPRAWVHEA